MKFDLICQVKMLDEDFLILVWFSHVIPGLQYSEITLPGHLCNSQHNIFLYYDKLSSYIKFLGWDLKVDIVVQPNLG